MTKECRTCKLIKPISEFYKRAGATRGYYPDCKVCESARRKTKRLSNMI